jgi:hypothetical protein
MSLIIALNIAKAKVPPICHRGGFFLIPTVIRGRMAYYLPFYSIESVSIDPVFL